jgi:Holliday junction resolvase RusA-like endonuclease
VIEFFVPGRAVPGGSKKAIPHRSTGKTIVLDMGGKRGKVWRQTVSAAARAECGLPAPLDGPLWMTLEFRVPRPRSHYGTGRNHDKLKPSAPAMPIHPPDALKLARSVEDALKGIVYVDDARIVDGGQSKRYAEPGKPPGVTVRVAPAGEGAAP